MALDSPSMNCIKEVIKFSKAQGTKSLVSVQRPDIRRETNIQKKKEKHIIRRSNFAVIMIIMILMIMTVIIVMTGLYYMH